MRAVQRPARQSVVDRWRGPPHSSVPRKLSEDVIGEGPRLVPQSLPRRAASVNRWRGERGEELMPGVGVGNPAHRVVGDAAAVRITIDVVAPHDEVVVVELVVVRVIAFRDRIAQPRRNAVEPLRRHDVVPAENDDAVDAVSAGEHRRHFSVGRVRLREPGGNAGDHVVSRVANHHECLVGGVRADVCPQAGAARDKQQLLDRPSTAECRCHRERTFCPRRAKRGSLRMGSHW